MILLHLTKLTLLLLIIPIFFKPSTLFFVLLKKTAYLRSFLLTQTFHPNGFTVFGPNGHRVPSPTHPRGVDLGRFGSFEERPEAFPSSTLPELAERASTVAPFQVAGRMGGKRGRCDSKRRGVFCWVFQGLRWLKIGKI